MASFLSLNTNGLRDANKRIALLHWLSHMSLDFACLQETHVASPEECNSWFSSYGFLFAVSPGSSHSCGSVILFQPKYLLLNSWTDERGRFVLAEFKEHNVTFRVACLYGLNRNPDRDDVLSYCSSKIDPSIPTLICGDFNTVIGRSLDRQGSNVLDSSRESSIALVSLFWDCGVVDI